MSRIDEIKKRINEIENAEFLLQMDDHWSHSDYELSKKHHEEVKNLEKELAELEKEENN